MKTCQQCGLLSPDSALRCDCGYCFPSQRARNTGTRKRAADSATATHHAGTAHRDVRGYYRILGVASDSALSEIKSAYRKKAKELHPDRSSTTATTEAFQQLLEAYEVLRDPAKRADYDTQSTEYHSDHYDGSEENIVEPIVCWSCGHVSAQPRYVIFYEVVSFLIATTRNPVQGIFCKSCADKKLYRATIKTWLLGWWGIPWGPIYSIHAILTNLVGGKKPRDVNARLLARQAWYFGVNGRPDLAISVANVALTLSSDNELSDGLRTFLSTLAPYDSNRQLKNVWNPLNRAFVVQAGLLLLAIAVAAFGYSTNSDRYQRDTLRTSTGIPREIASGRPPSSSILPKIRTGSTEVVKESNTRHVSVDGLRLRAGPGTTHPITTVLDRFATVTISGHTDINGWIEIITKDGVHGFVAAQYLGNGDGMAAKQQWCFDNRGARPPTGYQFIQRSSGNHELMIRNGRTTDAVVKLKDNNGKSVLAFYVRAGEDASMAEIPEGIFHLQFATGHNYSNPCGMFLNTMAVLAFPKAIEFKTTSDEYYVYSTTMEFTLHSVPEGNIQPRRLPLEEFLAD